MFRRCYNKGGTIVRIAGKRQVFRDNFKSFPYTRGGDPTDVTIKETADSFFHIRGSDPDMAFGTAFLFCFPY